MICGKAEISQRGAFSIPTFPDSLLGYRTFRAGEVKRMKSTFLVVAAYTVCHTYSYLYSMQQKTTLFSNSQSLASQAPVSRMAEADWMALACATWIFNARERAIATLDPDSFSDMSCLHLPRQHA